MASLRNAPEHKARYAILADREAYMWFDANAPFYKADRENEMRAAHAYFSAASGGRRQGEVDAVCPVNGSVPRRTGPARDVRVSPGRRR